MRVGIGYDIHRFDEGRRLVLGGVEFPGEKGLAGHSDADALLHAIIDAVLGAAGVGDIGRHFPPSDRGHEGANSLTLLRAAAGMVSKAGFLVANVDATGITGRPRLAEAPPDMAER